MHQHSGHLMDPTFSDLWSPGLLLMTILLAVVYLLVTGPLRSRFSGSEQVSARRKSIFLTGLFFFYLAQGSPLNFYGHHYLFSAHMVQQSFLYLAMPPLLLIGLPAWLLGRVFRSRAAKGVLAVLTNPIVGAVTFNMLFSFYHLPFIFDRMALDGDLMMSYHLVLVFAAFMMWWPIVSPLAEQSKLSGLRKIAYIFANSVLITPACALIIFSDSLLYTTYSQVPELIQGHTPFADQRLGGILMKLIQEGVYGSVLAYTFFSWYKKEREKDKLEFAEILASRTPDHHSRA